MKASLRFNLKLAWMLGALAAGANSAHAWWDGDWSARKLITIDTSSTGTPISDKISGAPVLLRLHDGNFAFTAAKADGTDLRFVAADDKTLLPYHIEKYDSLLDEAFVWVRVPEVKAGAKTTFWMYFGNPGPKAVKTESAKDTYDSNTTLVYHFNEKGQPPYDFSGQGNSASSAGIPAEGSMIGSGLRLDGKSSVTIPGSTSLAWTEGGTWTWSAWVQFGAPQSNAILFSRHDGDKVFVIGADKGAPFVALTAGRGVVRSFAVEPVQPNTWHHLAVVAAGESIMIYLDGDHYGSANGQLPAMTGDLVLGGDGSIGGSGATGFVGQIDELQMAKVARPDGFIRFSAVEQASDGASKLLTYGVDEQPTNILSFLKKGYIGVIIGSLTMDGWAVIGLLAIMSLVSWVVMVTKARYLTRVGKSNQLFLREWRKVASDLGAIDRDQDAREEENEGGAETERADAEETEAAPPKANGVRASAGTRHSPLYHIYHLGMEEIGHRLRAQEESENRRGISGRSMEAIRATLDGGLVRENQRLTSQMVLLTIAISGGPFLGLLGTVVGVMITFAAVAQAGDVNVNAIAPGIAAALAATVAGLGVAIPALFGYNYLLTQIKSATGDMQVFIDEFVTKLAETHAHDEE